MVKYKASRRKQEKNIASWVRQRLLRYNAKNMIHERVKLKNLASSSLNTSIHQNIVKKRMKSERPRENISKSCICQRTYIQI